MILAVVEPDGTILIPDEILKAVGVSDGEEFEVEVRDREIFLRRVKVDD